MLDKLNQLTESHGELKAGRGMVSGVIALSLAILCFLGVLAFHWPEYLTTPQLRKSYNVDILRQVMYWSLVSPAALPCSTSSSAACAGCRRAPSS